MLRNDLLENNYQFELIEPKKVVINAIWVSLALVFMTISVLLFMAIYLGSFNDISIPYIEFNSLLLNIVFIVMPFIYFIFKDILTSFFCSNKNNHSTADLFAKTETPVWNYREAFAIWQIVLIYLLPMIFMYPMMLGLSVLSSGNISLLIMIFIMTFFMTSDLTLVIYVLFLKSKYNTEYIAINNHVYSLTLYSTNLKINIQKKVDDINIKDIKIKEKKINKINIKLPEFRFKFSKKIILIYLALLPVAFIYLYITNVKISETNSIKALIQGYDGSLFANPDITFDGTYISGKNLAGNNILVCSDYQLVIYYDSEKESLMYLHESMGQIRKLCIYEKCEKNYSGHCGHVPNFVNDGCFSDCYLYKAVNLYGAQNSYIVRYNVILNRIEKIFEFDLYDETVYIQKLLIHGRYLYAMLLVGEKEYLDVVRIDLEEENACILYSDNKDATNKNKIEGMSLFYENYIICVTLDQIYKCDLDLKNFDRLTAADNVGQLDIYGGYIYYSDTESKKLYRCNIKSKTKELLLENAFRFYIDGDFIYYTLCGLYETKDALGILISSELYKSEIIYRTKLESEYLDFYNKVEVYKPEQGYYLGEWGVKNEYIYTLIYFENSNMLSRINVNSNSKPYLFWKKSSF